MGAEATTIFGCSQVSATGSCTACSSGYVLVDSMTAGIQICSVPIEACTKYYAAGECGDCGGVVPGTTTPEPSVNVAVDPSGIAAVPGKNIFRYGEPRSDQSPALLPPTCLSLG